MHFPQISKPLTRIACNGQCWRNSVSWVFIRLPTCITCAIAEFQITSSNTFEIGYENITLSRRADAAGGASNAYLPERVIKLATLAGNARLRGRCELKVDSDALKSGSSPARLAHHRLLSVRTMHGPRALRAGHGTYLEKLSFFVPLDPWSRDFICS